MSKSLKKRMGGRPKKTAVHSQPQESLGQLIQFIQTVKPEDIGKENLLQKFAEQQGEVSDDLKQALAWEQAEANRPAGHSVSLR